MNKLSNKTARRKVARTVDKAMSSDTPRQVIEGSGLSGRQKAVAAGRIANLWAANPSGEPNWAEMKELYAEQKRLDLQSRLMQSPRRKQPALIAQKLLWGWKLR